jgi:hypothetical protein
MSATAEEIAFSTGVPMLMVESEVMRDLISSGLTSINGMAVRVAA